MSPRCRKHERASEHECDPWAPSLISSPPLPVATHGEQELRAPAGMMGSELSCSGTSRPLLPKKPPRPFTKGQKEIQGASTCSHVWSPSFPEMAGGGRHEDVRRGTVFQLPGAGGAQRGAVSPAQDVQEDVALAGPAVLCVHARLLGSGTSPETRASDACAAQDRPTCHTASMQSPVAAGTASGGA